MKVIVVGAGVTGLYLADKLLQMGAEVDVYEASGRVGGRWRTKDGLELGAWRLSLESHPRALRLVQKHAPVDPIEYDLEGFVGRCSPPSTTSLACPPSSGLSVRDRRALDLGSQEAASRVDLRSGYHGQDRGACTVREVYGTRADGSETQERETGRFGAVGGGGFEDVARRLAATILSAGGKLHLGHRIVTADAFNRVRGTRRLPEGRFVPFRTTEPADWLVWCVPPHLLPRDDDGQTGFDLVAASVLASPLVHVYAPSPPGAPSFKIRTDLAVSQLIHHHRAPGWWQPCYAAGDHARFWMRLHQDSPKSFAAELRRQCAKILSRALPSGPANALLATLDDAPALKVAYWEEAIHMWAPAWGGAKPVAKERMRLACRPSYARRPRVCVAGEAISTHQGWTEGCIQTADEVFRIIRSPNLPRCPGEETLFRGMPVVWPEGWWERHPGGRLALRRHYGEEIEDLWMSLHSSARARQQLFALIARTFCFE